MPLNMNNPVVRAEKQPPQVIALGSRLKGAYGTPAVSFGIKGDASHLTGYHRSFNTLTQVPGAGGWEDYSIQSVLDKVGIDRDDNSACDYTPAPWGSALCRQRMIEHTTRMYQACKRSDPRVRAVREFAGTFDGRTVVRFRNDGSFSSPFDLSHLWHWHLSFYRSRVRWDHSDIAEIIIGEESGMKMILVAEGPGTQVWLSNLMTRVPVTSVAQLNNIKGQATGTHWGADIWQSGTILNVGVGNLHAWGTDITAGNPVELTPEQLEEITEAARQGAESGDAASATEVREIVDSELDEAFGGARDTDT